MGKWDSEGSGVSLFGYMGCALVNIWANPVFHCCCNGAWEGRSCFLQCSWLQDGLFLELIVLMMRCWGVHHVEMFICCCCLLFLLFWGALLLHWSGSQRGLAGSGAGMKYVVGLQTLGSSQLAGTCGIVQLRSCGYKSCYATWNKNGKEKIQNSVRPKLILVY